MKSLCEAGGSADGGLLWPERLFSLELVRREAKQMGTCSSTQNPRKPHLLYCAQDLPKINQMTFGMLGYLLDCLMWVVAEPECLS
jgi:hypothetical protein